MLPYKIGDTTSMGWKVLNIEWEYNNKYYSYYEYIMLIQKSKQRYIRRKQIKTLCLNMTKSLLYYILGLIIILYYIK